MKNELFNKFEIIKEPKFENDSMLIYVEFNTNSNVFFEDGDKHKIFKISSFDLYTQTKLKMFRTQDDNPRHLLPFVKNRSSLRNIKYFIEHDIKISNTIYTASIYKKNNYETLEDLMKAIDYAVNNYSSNSRRIYVNNANTYNEYYDSEVDFTMDVSCLVGIHYLQNSVNLIFRASDINDELTTDLITIADSFIIPIYKTIVPINVLISTAQNIHIIGD